ncbi:MAG: hypothetical protein AB7L13_20520 [Acidimicrobiia bacterium]
MTQLIDTLSDVFRSRSGRRSFLVRTTVVGSAIAVQPLDFLMRPADALAVACRCGNPACGCGSTCCDGYTEMCCMITGSNTCPPGSFLGGWWKADGSSFCDGPRYYMDCHTQCSCGDGCRPGAQSFCTDDCDPGKCKCFGDNCNNRAVSCRTFRYGQCHTEIACSGKIVCRVISCTPAYVLDPSCSTVTMVDNFTANHNRPCLQEPLAGLGSYAFASAGNGGGWLAARDGGIFAFGGAPFFGSMGGQRLNQPVIGIAASATGKGYWMIAGDGGIFAFGDAPFFGSMGGRRLNKPIVGMAPTNTGKGYWMVASDGGVFAFGDAQFYGSTGSLTLNKPVISITPTPSGRGYWMVASDGGIFAFGDAQFYGSTGGRTLRAPIGGMVATNTGKGYWMWGRDGTVYPFGDARSLGSYADLPTGRKTLPGEGLEMFVGLVPSGARNDSYQLWAVSALGPPPSVDTFQFVTV